MEPGQETASGYPGAVVVIHDTNSGRKRSTANKQYTPQGGILFEKRVEKSGGETMPRIRSPERDQAKDIYIKHKGEIQLTDIAAQLNLSEGTVRGWKAKDNWDAALNGTLQTAPKKNKKRSKRNTERSKHIEKKHTSKVPGENPGRGASADGESETNTQSPYARPGNRNAVGNRGGPGGPIRNKHALRSGEYESIFFTADIMDEEERALLDADYDKYVQQYLLIDTLTIREKRILQRIKSVKEAAAKTGMVPDSATIIKGKEKTSYTNRDKDGKEKPGTDMNTTRDNSSVVSKSVIKRIMELEDALTRVQARKQAAIVHLHRMERDDERLMLDHSKLEIYKQRISGKIDLDDLIGDDDLEDDL